MSEDEKNLVPERLISPASFSDKEIFESYRRKVVSVRPRDAYVAPNFRQNLDSLAPRRRLVYFSPDLVQTWGQAMWCY